MMVVMVACLMVTADTAQRLSAKCRTPKVTSLPTKSIYWQVILSRGRRVTRTLRTASSSPARKRIRSSLYGWTGQTCRLTQEENES